jgi:hypothetical protein
MLQPLFAAFASIAFFKLVIFSIFEIRYMFIIHQSRNSQSVNAVRGHSSSTTYHHLI